MAYRPLVEGDKVKIKNLNKDHVNYGFRNMFGEVYNISGNHVSIAFGTTGKVFHQDELMVASDDLSGSIYRFRNIDFNTVDEEDECEYADCDRDDLIEKINSLKSELEEINAKIKFEYSC